MKDILELQYYKIPGFMNYYLYKQSEIYYVVSSKSFRRYPNGYWLKGERITGRPLETKFKLVEDTGDYKTLTVLELLELITSQDLIVKYSYVPRLYRRRTERSLRPTKKGSVVKEKSKTERCVIPNFSGLVIKEEKKIIPFTFE